MAILINKLMFLLEYIYIYICIYIYIIIIKEDLAIACVKEEEELIVSLAHLILRGEQHYI